MDRTSSSAKVFGIDRERLRSMFGWLTPGQSLISHQPLPGNARFTAEEFSALAMLTSPYCDQCAIPFDPIEENGLVCGACLANPPPWNKARSALLYDDISSQLILSLKRRGQRFGLKVFSRFISDAAGDLIESADLIIPVPIHYHRLASRGFNQAGWLASAIRAETGIPYDEFCLKRTRATPSQGRMTARQRQRNVSGAFSLTERGRERIYGKRIILLDDVYTTGATLRACARTLQRAKPANLDVVTFARVVAPANSPI